jgi:hypothetical protein
MLIPSLVKLLARESRSLSFNGVSLLERLGKHGEWAAIYRIGITDVEVKTNFVNHYP